MIHQGFRYKISVEVVFHPVDLIILLYASARHYDSYCRGLGEQDRDGMPGSLSAALCYLTDLDGKHVRAEEALDTEEKLFRFLGSVHEARTQGYFLTFRELDLMAKTMEYYGMGASLQSLLKDLGLPVSEAPDPRFVAHINEGLRNAMDAINKRHGELGPSL